MDENILKQNAMQCLIDKFGIVDTERFISLISKEQSNYTDWQENLYTEMTFKNYPKEHWNIGKV